MPRIAVLGAGIVGLSVAVQVQKEWPQAEVTLVAEKFDKDTTSDGAAGIVIANRVFIPGVPHATIIGWLRDSWIYYDSLARSNEANEAGVQIISGYKFTNNPDEGNENAVPDLMYSFRPMTERELKMFPGHDYKYGWFVTTLMVECRYFLPYLMKRFKLGGGQIESRRVTNLNEFAGIYDAVVNCTGLGSGQLLNDSKMTAARGQVFRVKAPWIKHFILTADFCYVFPGRDNVVVGGTKQIGDHELRPRSEDGDVIWEKACSIFPSLRTAEIERQWVGLRPVRDPLRLEREVLALPKGSLNVVHNYGHGGFGVALGWGTAVEAVKILKTFIQQQQQPKKQSLSKL